MSKAELWLPVDPSTTTLATPSRQIYHPFENEAGEAVPTDQTSIGLAINENYDAAENAYRFNISQTFQRMLIERTNPTGSTLCHLGREFHFRA